MAGVWSGEGERSGGQLLCLSVWCQRSDEHAYTTFALPACSKEYVTSSRARVRLQLERLVSACATKNIPDVCTPSTPLLSTAPRWHPSSIACPPSPCGATTSPARMSLEPHTLPTLAFSLRHAPSC